MSCRLWVMLIFIIFQWKYRIMAFNFIEECFYEKRSNTALHGYNDYHDHWTSEFDCFNRCFRSESEKCRSFEHWHQEQRGLCVRTNTSSRDYPAVTTYNKFVDYYEINCQKDSKVLKTSIIHCPDDQLYLTIKLNNIDSNRIFLGDKNCKPTWSNQTHGQFITNIDNCSLILTNDSLIGKLHWEIESELDKSIKKYARFFTCPTNLYQIRYNHRLLTTSSYANSRNTFSLHPNNLDDNDQHMTLPYRITVQWTLHNRSYSCPKSCFIPLYSFLNITLTDSALLSSKFLIDSCDLIALPPYTNYFQSPQLISQGCSVDPTVISVSNNSFPLSVYHFSFYLYHILKEPIPFEIQCKILQPEHNIPYKHHIDCLKHNHHLNDKRDYPYILFRSVSIVVTRQKPLTEPGDGFLTNRNSFISITTVHYIECSLFAFFVLILYTI